MEDLFPKAYEPKNFERSLYIFWEENGMFIANSDSPKPAYSVIMPPPNVTGVLHMGHALVNTLQDILVRYKRMCGFEVCWVPGTDHAGIATQTVVEKYLYATQKRRRIDFSREEFLNHVWAWKEKSEKVILSQLRQLGCSCDWSRLHFTMDPSANASVKKAFKLLFDQGLIYRGLYLVNWDPIQQTALADDEVEYEERDGWLYYIRYRVVGSDEVIVVATTRPETLLGDTAIAVHPDDVRYSHLIGKKVLVPFVNREIPIIGDHFVQSSFGTGAVKITPAHDKDDYRMAERHDLPMINILTPSGEINENGGEFIHQTKEQARESILIALNELGLLEKKEPYVLRVGVSYRSGAVIEPYLSKQWFVSVESFRESLERFVVTEDITIFPSDFKKNYLMWIHNLKDWCISRQLWWGHRIPIWYHKEDDSRMICYDGEGLPPEVEADPKAWYQDPDVLDTWFSSGLWPLTCLGWPNTDSKDLLKFYPTSVLVTGHDILFFWVTRMVLMCSSMTGIKPFSDVFLHGLIFGKSYKRCDDRGEWTYITGEEKLAYDQGKALPKGVTAKWEKLSKSKGNVIDPLEMISLYGADAVRMTLCSLANRGEQIDLDYRVFEECKNFVNKIWNGARFIFSYLKDSSQELLIGIDKSLFSLEDYHIIDSFNHLLANVNQAYEEYAFDKIASLSYEFFKNDLCSTYLEIIKPILSGKQGSDEQRTVKRQLLVVIFVNVLGVLHPIVPFITETLFLKLKKVLGDLPEDAAGDCITEHAIQMLKADACMLAKYPSGIDIPMPENLKESVLLAERLVYTIRNIRGEMQLDPRVALDAFVICPDRTSIDLYLPMMQALGGLRSIACLNTEPQSGTYSLGVVDDIQLGIIVPREYLDKEVTRLYKEQVRLETAINNLTKLLSSNSFKEKADPKVVQSKEDNLKKYRLELENIVKKLASFS